MYTNINAQTTISISGNQFLVNNQLTYKDRYWKGNKIEGLLFNSRMVNGIFDDLNLSSQSLFIYPDTKTWDAERNTNEFIDCMKEWKKNGLIAFTLNLQGGSPIGYGNKTWHNSAFDEKGMLRQAYMHRLEKILNKADELNMIVILGYFYFGQDQHLINEDAIINATDNITNWILDKNYKNVLIEINNECNIDYDHAILQPDRVHELIERVKQTYKNGYRLLVSTSFGGGTVPNLSVINTSDFVLLHGNGVDNVKALNFLIEATKKNIGNQYKPIIFNEDDHFDFESDTCNFIISIKAYVSWGYFDYRMKEEGIESGFQSIPVDWGINSKRKKSFFLN